MNPSLLPRIFPALLLLGACQAASPDVDDDGGDDGGDGGATDDGGLADGGGSDGGGNREPVFPDPTLAASPNVIDPTLDGSPTLSLGLAIPDRADVDCTVEVELVGEHGDLRRLDPVTLGPDDSADLDWDGLDDDGAAFAPGLVDAWAWSDCADGSRGSASLPLAVLRLAPAQLALSTDDDADHYALAFHKSTLTSVQAQTGGQAYQLAGGVFDDDAPVALPWGNPDVAPWSTTADPVAINIPTAVRMGAALTAVVQPATVDSAGRSVLPDGVTVSLTSPGAASWSADATVPAGAADDTVGRGMLTLAWQWSACLGQDCTPEALPGSRTTQHELYRLLGPPQLRDGSAEGYADGTAWIGVLADTADAVEGAIDIVEVMDALRDRVHTDPWLIYDPSDRSYSDYEGSYIYWDSITSELSSWLDRSDGLSLYCHSVSCLLSTMAQTWGVDAEQSVLGVGFTTNQLRAAGQDGWSRYGFNSHSVATIEDGAWVWDAAVDMDGDDDPYNQPVDPLSPKGMSLDEYLYRLTYDDIDIVNNGKCFVR